VSKEAEAASNAPIPNIDIAITRKNPVRPPKIVAIVFLVPKRAP
jgi:hypothetical protein